MTRPRFLALVGCFLAPIGLIAVERDATVVVISMDGLPADYFEDPRADMPTLRSMAKAGARAERMEPVFPTVTWPNHTTLVTGVYPARHGVVANRYYDRAANKVVDLIWDPVFDKEQIVRVPTIYDLAHQAGLKTAGIAWPGSRNAKHLDWQVPCVIDPELLSRYTTPVLRAEFEAMGISPGKKAEWNGVDVGGKALWDWMHTRMAKHVIQTYRPNLLLLHLDLVDALEHRNGRNSPEAYWACNVVDHVLREISDAIATAGLANRTTLFLVSDHGFRNYTKQVNLNPVLRDAGLVKTAGARIVASQVHFLPMGGSAGLYIIDEAKRRAIASELVPRLKLVEGVDAVLEESALVQQGLPTAAVDSRVPDIMITAAEGYTFAGTIPTQDPITPIAGVKGAHGHLPDHPMMQATFIAWGAAIKPGVVVPRIRNVDVAPTIAAVLGLELRDVDGRVLSEILR